MNRADAVRRLQNESFDVLVIGGGATGLGCAVDAASRGYRTALVEAHDFAAGTSSRSTKLIHGGVRYLRQGNLALVREALREREALLENAPGLVKPLPFLIPVRSTFERWYYAAGLRLYDALCARSAVPKSRALPEGIVYYDAQFDDARLAIALATTAWRHGAALANYVRIVALRSDGRQISGAEALDGESGDRFTIRARATINATGIFADEVRLFDEPRAKPQLRFSRGTHIVVPAQCMNMGERALLVPKTADGRVLFAVPWHGHALIGTTDVAAAAAEIDPAPSDVEIDWLLRSISPYAPARLARSSITSVFAGLRPLLRSGAKSTARLSREHRAEVSQRGLVSITGGKWTTYRTMAKDAVDLAAGVAALAPVPCRTQTLQLARVAADPDLEQAVSNEMARTLDDLLARRKRMLFVDAREAAAAAPQAAELLAYRLGRDEHWAAAELRRFEALARAYMAI